MTGRQKQSRFFCFSHSAVAIPNSDRETERVQVFLFLHCVVAIPNSDRETAAVQETDFFLTVWQRFQTVTGRPTQSRKTFFPLVFFLIVLYRFQTRGRGVCFPFVFHLLFGFCPSSGVANSRPGSLVLFFSLVLEM